MNALDHCNQLKKLTFGASTYSIEGSVARQNANVFTSAKILPGHWLRMLLEPVITLYHWG